MCACLNIGHSLIICSIDFNIVNIHHTVGMYFLILNDMIFKDHIIQYMIHFLLLPWECIGKYSPRDSISWYTPEDTGTHPCVENIDNAPAVLQIGNM